MTIKQRLACGARILASIDARRKRTCNENEFLAVEQAILDRELMELIDTETLRRRERHTLWQPPTTGGKRGKNI